MNMKFLATSAVAAVMLSAPAFAATVLIDDFSTDQIAADKPRFGVTSTSTANTGSFIGDERIFTVTNTERPGDAGFETVLEANSGILSFNNVSGAQGTATLTYNGLFDLMNTVDKGYFFFDVIAFDSIANFMLSGRDVDGNELSYNEFITSTFDPVLRFSAIDGSDVFDFSQVASLSFSITSDGLTDSTDGRLDSISVSAVPVPAAGLMLLGALGGAAALRRRKAKKAA